MCTGSPGSVWILHLWSVESDPAYRENHPGYGPCLWSRSDAGAEQAQYRAQLGGQCAARTHRLDQGSAGTGLGCDGGGGTSSGLKCGRQHYWDRARGTRTRLRDQGADDSRARARLGQGSNTRVALGTGGSVMAHARMQGARALEGTKQGGLEERNEQNEHERAGGKK